MEIAGVKVRKSKKKPEDVYYLGAEVRRTRRDDVDYADYDTHVEAWLKASSEDEARDLSASQLLSEGWSMKKIHILAKVDPGFARIGSMLDPPIFSDEEADAWTEQYWIADAEGCAYAYSHFDKKRKTAMQPEKKHTVKGSLKTLDLSRAGSAIELEISCDGELLGTMQIGHGSMGWKPRKKRSFKRIDWSTLSEYLNAQWEDSH